MTTVTQELKEFLYAQGADLIGCADLRQISAAELPYGLAIAVALPPTVVEGITDGPTLPYFDAYHQAEQKLKALVLSAEDFLRSCGYQAIARTPDRVPENEQWRTALPHKTIATLGGLGWIGKNCLLVTEQYGSAIRLTSLLTDAPLDCNGPVLKSNCGGCRKCVDACPAKALHGALWTPGLDRDAIVDVLSCQRKQVELTRRNTGIEKEFLCGKCFAVCPFTQRWVKNAR